MRSGSVPGEGPAAISSLDYFCRMPKTELHLHLEGAIPLTALRQLLQKYESASEALSLSTLESMFQFNNFEHFLEMWTWKNRYIRSCDDFEFIAHEVAKSLASQNIIYAEIYYSPSDFRKTGLSVQSITEAIRRGLNRSKGVKVSLIVDLVRDYGPVQAVRTLEEISEIHRTFDVIGIGIGGSERLYPPGLFTKAYDKARSMGLHTTVHAGEACGPESVRDAIQSLRPDRIGHATHAILDFDLCKHLAESQIPLELCIISNVLTRSIESIASHPARQYFDLGIPISINTDDPTLFNNSVAAEYEILHTQLGFSLHDIHSVALQTIHSTWISEIEKSRLRDRFNAFISTQSITQKEGFHHA